MESFKPGSILINTATNKLYGVLVSTLPNNKIIVFRLDKNTHPIFSKFELHPHIAKVGIINEYQYSNLKTALLKHYRTYNLTASEKKLLEPLMIFAFPLGIPEYQPDVELPERDLQFMDIHSKLTPGSRFYVNTPTKSCHSHLDNKILTVLDKDEHGIWCYLPTGETDINNLGNNIRYLFYKNKDIPTFGGISRISPIVENIGTGTGNGIVITTENKEKLPEVNTVIADAYNAMKERDELTTTMEFNGDKVRVIPKTNKVILPEILQNMVYNPTTDSFTVDPAHITPEMSRRLGDKLIIGGNDKTGNVIVSNNMDNEIVFTKEMARRGTTDDGRAVKMTETGELVYEGDDDEYTMEGGAKVSRADVLAALDAIEEDEAATSKYSSLDPTDINIDDIMDAAPDADDDEELSRRSKNLAFLDEDEEELNNIVAGVGLSIGSRSKGSRSSTPGMSDGETTDAETDYDDEEIMEIINEDEIVELGTFEKVRRIEVDKLEKVYKESIQIGDLYQYKIEKIPYLRRNDTDLINKINKEISIITLLKNHLTNKDNTINIKPQDYRPLIDKYVKGDFSNKFLIPLVVNRKRIYLDKAKQGQKDEYDKTSHMVVDDYYKNLEETINLQDKKNNSINNDGYLNNVINEMNPNPVSETESMGILFRMGSEFDSNDYSRLNQDTLTIKYCDKPYRCQSYTLSPMNFDYQVNIGPMGRFIDEDEAQFDKLGDEDEDEDDDEKLEDSILSNKPYFKTYYDGDLISVIGYVRPPLEYFNTSSCGNGCSGTTLLSNMYKAQKEADEVITINLLDIDPEVVDENQDEQFSITQHPDKFVLFLLPQEGFQWRANMAEEVGKIIPNIDDLIKVYLNKAKDNTIEHIYNVLDKFEYDTRNLSLEVQNKIMDKHADLIEKYETFNEKMEDKFEAYKTRITAEMESKEKDKKNRKDKGVDGDSGLDGMDGKAQFKYITDDILEDIGKFYYETYENKGISIDADDIRLRWFMTSFDNGNYFFKTLFMDYLKKYQEEHKLDNLETELAILKEKHAVIQTNAQMLGVEGSAGATAGATTGTTDNTCAAKTATGPNVIKYPSLARLEKDNGKVATDSDGNIIMQGDYALVNVDNGKQLFKREIIGNVDMWIKEELSILYKLIQDKKNRCLANPDMTLENANKCTFDPEALKCDGNAMLDMTKQTLEMELLMNDLQREIDYVKKIPRLIAALNKDITEDRLVLVGRLNAMKRYWRNKEEEEKLLDEVIKKSLITKKPCIHFDVVDYFNNIKGYYEDRYKFALSIFKNFLNNEPAMTHDYYKFDHAHPENNYTYCNICNQELLCNHFRLGASYVQEGNPVDYDKIHIVYGSEVNGSYYCKSCNESIGTTAILDFDDFTGGENGQRVRTRELAETTPLIEQQRAYINNMVDALIEGEQTLDGEELKRRINIFQLMKSLSGIDLMNTKDEIDMYNFLKSYNFESKNKILGLLYAKLGAGNPGLLNKQVELLHAKFTIADVAARFLILLQTSSTEYAIVNKGCRTNIIGYPLIGEEDASDGVDYIMCVLSQMSADKNYTVLADFKKSFLVDRIKTQVEKDSYIKDKLFEALNRKADDIDSMNEFLRYHTNYWKSYRPRMEPVSLTWQPEKILNEANLKEVNNKNYHRMIEVGHEDCIYYSLRLIQLMNNIIENSDKYNIKGLSNFCCLDETGRTKKYNYLDYYRKFNNDVNKYLDDIKDVKSVMDKLELRSRWPILNIIYDPLFKPSQAILPLTFNVGTDEIKEIYLKYIDRGINKGQTHIYDKYGRCVLSNEKKADIEAKTYGNQDYKRIEEAINSGNQIDIKKYIVDEKVALDTKLLEIKQLELIIKEIPKLDIMNYLGDFLNKMLDEAGDSRQEKEKGEGKDKGKDKFDINRHLSMLNSQIEAEIEGLVRKITATDKNVDKYSKIMSNLGDYRNLYVEYKETHGEKEAEIFRYNKKEEELQYTLKYLNDILNQIKNNKLSNPLGKESIRPQYRNFINFGQQIKLFKMLGERTRQIYDFARVIKSKQTFKMLFPEMVASILHYLNIISLVLMFDTLDTTKNGKTKVEEIKFNFKTPIKPDEALEDLNREMELGLEKDEDYLDSDEQVDFIESFEIKNSDNLKAVASFIITYLDRVDEMQNNYDTLTNSYVNLIITEHQQKHIENNLKSFEWLAREGHEVERQLVFIKLNKLKKINYANITEHLMEQYGEDIFNEADNYDVEVDRVKPEGGEIDEYGGGATNEMGLDEYEMEEQAEIFDIEEVEDAEQDYGMLAVDYDD